MKRSIEFDYHPRTGRRTSAHGQFSDVTVIDIRLRFMGDSPRVGGKRASRRELIFDGAGGRVQDQVEL